MPVYLTPITLRCADEKLISWLINGPPLPDRMLRQGAMSTPRIVVWKDADHLMAVWPIIPGAEKR